MGRKVRRREIKTNEKRAKKSKRAQILLHWAYVFLFCVFVFFFLLYCWIGRKDQYRKNVKSHEVRLSGKQVQSVCGGRFAPTKLKWAEREMEKPSRYRGCNSQILVLTQTHFPLTAGFNDFPCVRRNACCLHFAWAFSLHFSFFCSNRAQFSLLQLSWLNRSFKWPAEKRSRNINGSNNNKHSTPTIIGDL